MPHPIRLFDELGIRGSSGGRCSIKDSNDVVAAVRHFFTLESQSAAADTAPGSVAASGDTHEINGATTVERGPCTAEH